LTLKIKPCFSKPLPATTRESEMYTAQIDRHGNIIVCKGDTERNGYRIFFTGSYNECLNLKP
jgi:hypothetical protein